VATAPAQARRRRRLPPEERRAQLLEVALRIFARNGLGQARHAEIAHEAGVAVSTVFLYFPTREALVDAVLGEVDHFYLDLLERTRAPDLPARESLARQVQAFVASLETNPHQALVWLDWSTSFREENWQRFLGLMDRIVSGFAETIRRGQREGAIPAARDAEASARLLLGAGQTAVQLKLTGSDPETMDRFTRTVIDATIGR
jgi:TetR/AcrR family hemagglutinin/protease transcriptional regulator